MSNLVWLDELDLRGMKQGWLEARSCRAVTGNPLRIAGREYARGVGTHARSVYWLDLAGGATRFTAAVGVDDAAEGVGTLIFKIYGDGRRFFDSGVLKSGQPAVPVDVDLRGVQKLVLTVNDAGGGVRFGHANWVDAQFTGTRPQPTSAPVEPAEIRTPNPPATPRLNGPPIVGCRPGNPFLYRIPCTGARPLKLAVENLPAGLKLEANVITGSLAERGEYVVTLRAGNSLGVAERQLKIVCGDTLALTPPLGWNGWYAHGVKIADADMRAAADALVNSGMADHGYTYCNLDDAPAANFPDMKTLADYIHARGLKFGCYTSPGPQTCAGLPGSYQHEAEHARQYAAWGVDFLKYDFCTYWNVMPGKSTEDFIAPYRQMGRLLREQLRDIVFNLCQYGMANVWEWAPGIGGHCWRTTGDVGLEPNAALPGFYKVALANAALAEHAGPGRWNDPDYLLLGVCGDAHITPNEQYSYMSLWALMAAPLFFGGDMRKLDPFTLNILCNHEIIAVNQDELGRQARIVRQCDEEFILAKPLAAGSIAVGLFNLSEVVLPIRVSWEQLGLTGPRRVRDLWRQTELGVFATGWETMIGRHGVAVVSIT
ncbi:MAG: hypothetical protein PCFJNLEI_00862 [Verrucomicrobiae bacterium]|nr:hypothetical protein [Verrucomicrobiae bacterium]